MNRKNLPLFLMLVAGAITCVITFVQQYPILTRMTAVLVVLLVFDILGNIIRYTLDYFDKQNQKDSEPEGEVIEKEPDAEDAEGGTREEQDDQA